MTQYSQISKAAADRGIITEPNPSPTNNEHRYTYGNHTAIVDYSRNGIVVYGILYMNGSYTDNDGEPTANFDYFFRNKAKIIIGWFDRMIEAETTADTADLVLNGDDTDVYTMLRRNGWTAQYVSTTVTNYTRDGDTIRIDHHVNNTPIFNAIYTTAAGAEIESTDKDPSRRAMAWATLQRTTAEPEPTPRLMTAAEALASFDTGIATPELRNYLAQLAAEEADALQTNIQSLSTNIQQNANHISDLLYYSPRVDAHKVDAISAAYAEFRDTIGHIIESDRD